MITGESRYNPSRGGYLLVHPGDVVAVRRVLPPPSRSSKVIIWKETDRLDLMAARLFGKSRDWWRILDLNPLIQDPHDIRPGDPIRIPG